MEHRKLDALMSPMERIARVAAAGVSSSRAQQTSPSGAISLDNADGTRTIIGEVSNGESNPSYTMATHVGDTTPPGIPTGITATSRSGVVVVEWDGTLSGGIPDDFFCVRIYLDGTELGALSEAGSVASAKMESGTTHSITATSEDDCCLPDGTPAHNVSEATQAISVTVAKDAFEVMADIDEQIGGVEQEIADFKSNTYTKAQTDKKVKDLDDEISTELTTNYYNKTQIDTTYATKTLVSQTKEEIELSASQTYATKGAGNPNLSPLTAHDTQDRYNASTNPDGYWWANVTGYENIEDGWVHVIKNASTATQWGQQFQTVLLDNLKPSTYYTLLMEYRNVAVEGTLRGWAVYASSDMFEQPSENKFVIESDMERRVLLRTKDSFDGIATGADVRHALYAPSGGSGSCSYDLRLSIYECELDGNGDPIPYEGSFKPYVTDQASLSKEYSTKAELRVGLDSVSSEVSKAYESIDATTLAPFSDSVEGYLAPTAAGSATDPLHKPDARKERTSDYFDVTPGASYVFKGKATNDSATDQMWRVWRFYDEDGKTLGTRQGGNVGQGADEFEVTFTAPDDAASCRVSMTCFDDGRWQVLGDLTKTTADLSSSIKQTAESIESTVSAQLSDVRILGENILRNVVKPEIAGQVIPAEYDGKWFGSLGNQGAIVSTVDVSDSPQAGVTRAFRIDNSAYTGNRDAAQRIPDGIKAGEQLAFSAWVRGVGSDCRAQVRVWNTAAPTGAKFTWSKVVGTTWERIVIPVTLTADTNAANFMIGINGRGIIEWIAPVLLQGVDADLLAQEVESNYTKSSTFTQTVDGLDGRITATEDGLAVQETLIRQYAGGVLVAYTGNPVGALVNAAGQYDIVSLTWQDGEPTVGTTLASFTGQAVKLLSDAAEMFVDQASDSFKISTRDIGFDVQALGDALMLHSVTYENVQGQRLSENASLILSDARMVVGLFNEVTGKSMELVFDANYGLKVGDYYLTPEVLFSGSTSGTVTLSETAANFERLVICYEGGGFGAGSVEVWSPDGKNCHVGGTYFAAASSIIQQRWKVLQISGTSITRVSSGYINTSTAGAVTTSTTENTIAITKVIGYRKYRG